MKKEEFCIMQNNPPYWVNKRQPGLHRHEIFYGIKNRKKSIEDGLVIYLTPEMHNMSKKGIHFNKEFDSAAKEIAQMTWMNYYGKTKEDFIKRFGKNYI